MSSGAHSSLLRDDDRGQLILAGAVVIAALLIVLVLIMNGVLYTENIATRDQPQAIDRGVDIVSTGESATGELLYRENQKMHTEDGAAKDTIDRDLTHLEEGMSERSFEAHGEVLGFDDVSIQQAWVVKQNESATFEPAERLVAPGDVRWEVAEANGIREGEMRVDSAYRVDTDEEDEVDNVFTIEVHSETTVGADWELYVFEHPDETGISLGTDTDSDGNPIPECSSDDSYAEISFPTMTIQNGDDCSLEFGEGAGDPLYTMYFDNGDSSEGTYRFIFGQGDGASLGDDLGASPNVYDTTSGDDPEPDQPTAYDGVYSVTGTLFMDGEDTTVSSVIYGAPNQHHETRSGEEP